MKQCDILGVKTYSDPSYTYFQGSSRSTYWSTPLQKVIVSCTVTQKRLSWLYQLHSSIGQIVEMGKNRYSWGSALSGFCHYCKGSVESVLFGSSSVQPQKIWVRFWSGTVLIFFVLSSVLFGCKWVRSFDCFNFSAVMLKHFNTKFLHANGISVICRVSAGIRGPVCYQGNKLLG